MSLDQLLQIAVDKKASDLHLIVGQPPIIRIDGVLHEIEKHKSLDQKAAKEMIFAVISPELQNIFIEEKELDFGHEIAGGHRFRVNLHWEKGNVGLAARVIPEKIPAMEDLGMQEIVYELCRLNQGLILMTGPTGCGKSTSLAAMIDLINSERRANIITLEDPIEYMLTSNKCAIEQREIGDDCPTFASGLKHALRQDPDVIMVGEMRDLETSSAAITAAETGHLVLSTLHTINAPQTIERIIDIYPTGQQNQIRSMLANTLKGVISQTLLKRTDTPGMIPAIEVMLCTSAVRNCIRENRIYELPNVIETSRALGMQSLDTSIGQLYFNGQISREDALAHAAHPEKLERALSA